VFEHFITEDMTAYMKLLCGDTSRENFYKIMNRPKRGLDRDCCPYENNTLEQIKEYYRRDAERMNAIKRLQKDCQMARQMKPYAAVMYIRKKMGYEKWLLENTKEALLEEHMQILTLMQELSRQICTIDEWVAFIKSRSESYKGKDGNKEKGVLIATYHGSKGLEFDTVFMPDINEGKTPHRKAVSEKEIEEERRMYYVGITRAKEQLNLYYRTGTKEEPEQISRFLKDYI